MSGILTVMNKKIKRVKRNYKTKNSDSDVKLAVKVGYACCAAAEISGDAVISCGLPDGSRALILSDGMGTGIKAAAGSRLMTARVNTPPSAPIRLMMALALERRGLGVTSGISATAGER